MKQPAQANTLGNASLVLSIVSTSFVFGIGFCALVGAQQGWLQILGTVLYICGASSLFLGFLGFVLGLGGLFGKDRSRATAITGMILGFLSICLFSIFISTIGKIGGG